MIWDGLCPLIFRNLSLPWSPVVDCVDASEWGLGVVQARVPINMVKSAGRESERWRFMHPGFAKPRRNAATLEAADQSCPSEVEIKKGLTQGFKHVHELD